MTATALRYPHLGIRSACEFCSGAKLSFRATTFHLAFSNDMDARKYRANARLCRLIARTQSPHAAKLTRRMAADFEKIADRLDPEGARWSERVKHVLRRAIASIRLGMPRPA